MSTRLDTVCLEARIVDRDRYRRPPKTIAVTRIVAIPSATATPTRSSNSIQSNTSPLATSTRRAPAPSRERWTSAKSGDAHGSINATPSPFENPQLAMRKVSETPSVRSSGDAECCFVYCPARGDAVSRLLAKAPLSGPLWQLGVHPSPTAQGPERGTRQFRNRGFRLACILLTSVGPHRWEHAADCL